jgi:hypothetical protein
VVEGKVSGSETEYRGLLGFGFPQVSIAASQLHVQFLGRRCMQLEVDGGGINFGSSKVQGVVGGLAVRPTPGNIRDKGITF